MAELAPHMYYVYCGLLGCVVGAFTMGFFVMWLQKGDNEVSCKSHGECLQCQVDDMEDTVTKLNAKYQPLWDSLNDFDSRLEQRLAQVIEHIDDQLRKQEARTNTHSAQIFSLGGRVASLEKK